MPVEITGLAEAPGAGDDFHAVADERMARELVEQRKHENKNGCQLAPARRLPWTNLFAQIQAGRAART